MISEITEITDNTGWIVMWLLAGLLFVTGKAVVLIRSWQRRGWQAGDLSFALFCPAFDLAAWRSPASHPPGLLRRGWVNLSAGMALTWLIARHLPTPFVATWVCMVGFIVALHGGVFTLIAEYWQRQGRDVRPLMTCPIGAAALSDFWGRRWNTGFRDLMHSLVFKPMACRWSPGVATTMVFVLSGLLHELVITVPAGGGYGGPTVYFLLQALGVGIERGCPCRRHGWVWRVRTLVVVLVPLPLLFPPVFVERVCLPFFTFLRALP
jgi:alginate O-acetyltransferase complex protein AlgI